MEPTSRVCLFLEDLSTKQPQQDRSWIQTGTPLSEPHLQLGRYESVYFIVDYREALNVTPVLDLSMYQECYELMMS